MNSAVCKAVAHDVAAPHDVLPAIPGLLGFHPEDSLVVVFFDQQCHIVMTARMDWPDLVADLAGTEIQLRQYASRVAAVSVALLAAGPTQQPQRQESHLSQLATSLGGSTTGLTVLWLAHTQAGRWWSPDCIWTCGTQAHTLLEVHESPLAFSLSISGRAPAPTRKAALANLAEAEPGLARRVAMSLAPRTAPVCTDESLELLILLHGQLAPADLAEIIRACDSVPVRDELLFRFTRYARETPQIWTEGLESLQPALRHAPHDYLPGIASVVAFFHWQDGNGLLASAAVEMALAVRPRYRLARLVGAALAAGLPPTQWNPDRDTDTSDAGGEAA